MAKAPSKGEDPGAEKKDPEKGGKEEEEEKDDVTMDDVTPNGVHSTENGTR